MRERKEEKQQTISITVTVRNVHIQYADDASRKCSENAIVLSHHAKLYAPTERTATRCISISLLPDIHIASMAALVNYSPVSRATIAALVQYS